MAISGVVLISACSERVGNVEVRDASPPAAGELAHRLGRLDQTTIGECEEAVTHVAVLHNGAPVATLIGCQLCCGAERSPNLSEGRRRTAIMMVGADREANVAAEATSLGMRVWDVAADGALLAIEHGHVMRYDNGDWRVLARPDDIQPNKDQNAFVALDAAPDGTVYAATVSGVARIAGDERSWLLEPGTRTADHTPLVDGAVIAPNPTAQIRDLESTADGRVFVVTTDQIRVVDGAGHSRVVLDASTGETTDAAAIAPKQVEVVENLSSCCSSASAFASAAMSDAGNLYVLEATTGRVLRLPPSGPVSVVAGPSGPRYRECTECRPASRVFGQDGRRRVSADTYPLIPVLVEAPGGTLAIGRNGSLFIALGAAGLVELGAIDDIPDR